MVCSQGIGLLCVIPTRDSWGTKGWGFYFRWMEIAKRDSIILGVLGVSFFLLSLNLLCPVLDYRCSGEEEFVATVLGSTFSLFIDNGVYIYCSRDAVYIKL